MIDLTLKRFKGHLQGFAKKKITQHPSIVFKTKLLAYSAFNLNWGG